MAFLKAGNEWHIWDPNEAPIMRSKAQPKVGPHITPWRKTKCGQVFAGGLNPKTAAPIDFPLDSCPCCRVCSGAADEKSSGLFGKLAAFFGIGG